MTIQPLFLDTALSFHEKTASAFVQLGDNADMWPQEVMDEAYRQLPFLSDFDVHAVVDRVDEERGFAFGSIEVRPISLQTATEMEQNPTKAIQIPFVIREKKLAPLDVFINDKVYQHLTEGRVRSTLFRPDIFDSVRDRPPEQNLFADLQPPLEATGTGGGGVKLGSADLDKEAKKTGIISKLLGRRTPEYIGPEALRAASANPTTVVEKGKKTISGLAAQGRKDKGTTRKVVSKGSRTDAPKKVYSASSIRGVKMAMMTPLLPQLHGQVSVRHLDRLKTAMQDPSLRSVVLGANEGVQAAFASALQLEAGDPTKTAQIAWENIPPSVVQFRKLPSGNFMCKMANAEMYQPREEEVSPSQGEEMMSDLDLTAQVESDGTITASPDAAIKQTLDAEEIRVVDQPGVWKVQDKMGNTLTGWAFPQLLSLDMQPMPLTLFSNGSEHCIQEHIAGALLSKGTDLPKGRMQGYGAMYYLDHGSPRVFVPMTIKNSYRGADGSLHYTALTDLQEDVDLVFTENLKTVVRMGEREYAVPEGFSKWWMPLKSRTDLVNQPLMFTKYAGARPASGKGELVGDGAVFSFRGEPFSKVASEQVTFLSRPDAEFVGVAAGVDPAFMKEALDKAARGDLVKFDGLRTLHDPREKIAEARTKVANAVREVNLRNHDLIKVAAVLDDALTADKILGLGFLNAENVATFVSMLPGLEFALSQLSEMLVASRIGLKDIPEVALERAKVALEDVIQGLRTLKQREIGFAES